MKSISLLKKITKNSKVYLVGGAIRDYLLKREIKDIDLVVMSDLETIIEEFLKISGFKKIILDKERKIYRVITADNKFIDFTNPVGQDLYQDLGCRDFTINSMAIDLKNVYIDQISIYFSKEKIIDPYLGLKDLNRKKIKMVTDNFIQDDPLRILRTYRFSNNLKFNIEKKTIENVISNIELITNVNVERIKEELQYLFVNPLDPKFFKGFIKSGLTDYLFDIKVFKEESKQKLLYQYLNHIKNDNYLKKIKLDDYLINLIIFFILPVLENDFNIEKIEEKLIDFTFNKNKVRIIRDYLFSLNKILKDYKYLQNDDILIYEELFFKKTDINILKYFLLSLTKAELGIVENRQAVIQILNNLGKMRERDSIKRIDGNEVKEMLNLEEGRLIGKILNDIKKKQALGWLKSREEIIKYIKRNYY